MIRSASRPTRPAAALSLAGALALLAACGAPGEDRPATRPGDGTAPVDSAAIPSDSGALADSAQAREDAADPDTADPDTADVEDGTGADGWQRSEIAVAGDGHGVLTAVRTGRHDGYDRMVFEFQEAVPGYAVRYPTGPLRQCGSGQPILVDEPHTLQIVFRSAAAHEDAGQATVQDRRRAPSLPVIGTARLTCDFEGEVEWVLGVERRAGFRVLVLESPGRLVVDLRH